MARRMMVLVALVSGAALGAGGCADPVMTAYETAKLTSSDAAQGDSFGWAVSVSGDTAVVGARDADTLVGPCGTAYVFRRDEGGTANWVQVAKLVASDAAANDWFGSSVAVDGDVAVVGAPADRHAGAYSGSAYVFQRNAGGTEGWGQVAKLTASDAMAEQMFGLSVSVSGDTVIVGAHWDKHGGSIPGSAYIFYRDRGGADHWGQVAKMTASGAPGIADFGWSVSVSGDVAVVGASDQWYVNWSAAYVFYRDAGGADNWGQVATLAASDGADNDKFGLAVSVSGDVAIVGAEFADDPREGDEGYECGAAYVFHRDVGGADNWGQVAKLTAPDAEGCGWFGSSVSASGDVAVVGAEAARGAHEAGQEGWANGAAYVFRRNADGADRWGLVGKLVASDGAEYDSFGVAASVSGELVVVGAPDDDDAGDWSGSAYAFDITQPGMR